MARQGCLWWGEQGGGREEKEEEGEEEGTKKEAGEREQQRVLCFKPVEKGDNANCLLSFHVFTL